METIEGLEEKIVACRRCERLVQYRQEVARIKRRAYADDTYWGRPLPGWGDPHASLFLVGLAPGAHGANRTGRMFTGDSSADFLFASLYRAGFASQPVSTSRSDGTRLRGVYISNVVRCVPPDNKPAADEIMRCRDFLLEEFSLFPRLRCVLALGRLAFDQCVRLLSLNSTAQPARRPSFSHAAKYVLSGVTLIASYHPSQRNTATGLLTPDMLDAVFALARRSLAGDHQEADHVDQHAGDSAGHEHQ